MPLYEYACKRCGKTFEVMQKFSDTPLKEHEGCGGVLEKLLSTSSIQFKGSGWYVTDYARGGNSSSSNSGNGKSAKSEAKDDAKSDARKAAKKESQPASKTGSS